MKERKITKEIEGKTVELHFKGHRWWGLCPFHKETIPSFSVTADEKSYHCFGCGKSGKLNE